MIHARPSSNGNTPEHFREAYTDVQAAEIALTKAIRTVRMNVLHGRNYQHLPISDATLENRRTEDDEKLDPLLVALRALQRLETDIAGAISW